MLQNTNAGVDRRQFLRHAAMAVAGMVAVPADWPVSLRRYGRFAEITPDAAMKELLAGNGRYVASRMISSTKDLAALRQQTTDSQHPFAGVLACADSRVPVELVFDQSIGAIFAARVAGNIVTPEIIASLEYSVAALGVRALLVLGHSHCGAVTAAMHAEAEPGQISSLYPHITPAVAQAGGNLEKAVEINARMQAQLLRTSSTVIMKAINEKTLVVSAGVYDLASGRVTLL